MRKPEQKMWVYLASVMQGAWDAQRHEDKYSDSIPDVSFALHGAKIHGAEGWIELKTIKTLPKKYNTPVRIPHLTPGQVNWLERRGIAGNGKVYLLLAVGVEMHSAEWFLLSYEFVRRLYNGEMNVEELRLYSDLWVQNSSKKDLGALLKMELLK